MRTLNSTILSFFGFLFLAVNTVDGSSIPASQAASLTIPDVPGDGVAIELHNGIGGGFAPQPGDIASRTPDGRTLSPFIDFPQPGEIINVGQSFTTFFGSTASPPDQVRNLEARNFILSIRFNLLITSDLDLSPGTPGINIRLGVGSDDGFHLVVGSSFIGSAGDRPFTTSSFDVSFEQAGLYEVTLLFAANAVGYSGLEFYWHTAKTSGLQVVPQAALYTGAVVGQQVITFEEHPKGTVVTNQYGDRGITFAVTGDVQITDAFPTEFVPVTSPYVLGSPSISSKQAQIVEMNFVVPGMTDPGLTDLVQFYLIDADTAPGAAVVATDHLGQVVFNQRVVTGGGGQQQVTISASQIAKVRIELGGGGADTVAIDNVSFNRPVAITTQNIGPTLAEVPDQEIPEGAAFTYQLVANDPDGNADLLRFSFDSVVPPGLLLDAETGELRWTTGEGDGGSDSMVTVRVTDRGFPRMGATRTFRLRVIEQNEPPRLAQIPPQHAVAGQPFAFQVAAEDDDRPVQTLRYRLAKGGAIGMQINPTSGALAWTPRAAFAEQTIPVTIIVGDDGVPAAESSVTFLLTIDPASLGGPIIKQPANDVGAVESTAVAFDAGAAGNYAGLLLGDENNPDARGFLGITLGKAGAFSGSVRIGGTALSVKGKVGADGTLSASAKQSPNRTITLALALRRTATGALKLVGTATDATNDVATNFTADLQKPAAYTAKAPSPLAGNYTMLAVHDEGVQPQEPQGHGYATVTVSKTGKVTASGRLADGTPFTQGGMHSVDGEWPFYVDLYTAKPRGFLAGPLRFREVHDVSDFDGTLLWKRPALAKAATFKAGFSLSRATIGSKYAKPAKNQRALAGLLEKPSNAILDLVGEPVPPSSSSFVLTWDAQNVLRYSGPEKIGGQVAPAAGSLAGSFSTTNPKAAVKFGGVVFQKQGFAAGCFTTPALDGVVWLRPE